MIYCISCNSKNDNTLISTDEYLDYVNYDTTDWCKKCNAQSVLKKDILFNFDMKVPIDLSAIKYDFMIIRQGVIYIGPFEKNIIIKNVSIKRAINWASNRYKIIGTDKWNRNSIISKTNHSPSILSKPLK